MPNKFTTALKSKPAPVSAGKTAESDSAEQGRGKHIGGYFDPAVSKQMRAIALEEDSSVQALLEEAMDMLFQSRNLPQIATRKDKKG
jgi:hypothetical protein